MKHSALILTMAIAASFAFTCGAAQSEADMPAETEELTQKTQRNGFDEGEKQLVEIGGYTVNIPEYWKAQDEENRLDGGEEEYYCAYAERDGKVALLQMEAKVDGLEDVSFSVLQEQQDEISAAFGESFDTFICDLAENWQMKGDEELKGLIWNFTFEVQGQSGSGRFLMFPAQKENRWVQVLLMQTDNTDYDYTEDFGKILDTIADAEAAADENADLVYYRATTTINIRSAPDQTDDSNKLGKVPEGTVLKKDMAAEEQDNWVKVFFSAEDGSPINGWVSKDYVEVTEAPAEESETEGQAE